jgi:hypothetical protein
MKVTLGLHEVKNLFVLSGNYGVVTKEMQSKGGEWWAEISGRETDVLRFWNKLKTVARRTDRGWEFGPEDVPSDWSCEMKLDDEEREGAYLVLLSALDPRSPLKTTVGVAADVVWPVARKIRRESALKKELKIVDYKRPKIEDDPEPESNGAKSETMIAKA